jgi:hypothetical protein
MSRHAIAVLTLLCLAPTPSSAQVDSELKRLQSLDNKTRLCSNQGICVELLGEGAFRLLGPDGQTISFATPLSGISLSPIAAATSSGECFASNPLDLARWIRNVATSSTVCVLHADATVTSTNASYCLGPGEGRYIEPGEYAGRMMCIWDVAEGALARTATRE